MYKEFAVPNKVNDDNLTMHAFRVYLHLLRLAGGSGKCKTNIVSIADVCRMPSMGVEMAEQELIERRYIEVVEDADNREYTLKVTV